MKKILFFILTINFLLPISIYDKNAPACVRIDTIIPDEVYGNVGGCGSGFIVDKNGVIVTNHHVIDGAKEVIVTLPNGEVYKAQGFYVVDESLDFAILKIPGFDLPTVKLGNSNLISEEDEVKTIGNPLCNIDKNSKNTISRGIISQMYIDKGVKWIKVDASISGGNSGGPLFNKKGEVIGVNTKGWEIGQNLNSAVPINYIRSYINPYLYKTGLTYDVDYDYDTDPWQRFYKSELTPLCNEIDDWDEGICDCVFSSIKDFLNHPADFDRAVLFNDENFIMTANQDCFGIDASGSASNQKNTSNNLANSSGTYTTPADSQMEIGNNLYKIKYNNSKWKHIEDLDESVDATLKYYGKNIYTVLESLQFTINYDEEGIWLLEQTVQYLGWENVKVIESDIRIVNNNKILYAKLSGDMKPFSNNYFYAYAYSDGDQSILITSRVLNQDYNEKDIIDLLNGLELIEGSYTWPQEARDVMMNNCLEDPSMSSDKCDCFFSALSSSMSYQTFIELEEKEEKDLTDAELNIITEMTGKMGLCAANNDSFIVETPWTEYQINGAIKECIEEDLGLNINDKEGMCSCMVKELSTKIPYDLYINMPDEPSDSEQDQKILNIFISVFGICMER